VSTKAKRNPRRRKTAGTKTTTATRRRRKAAAPRIEAYEEASPVEIVPLSPPPAVVEEHEPEVQLSIPEPSFAARVPPPAPERPHPDRRRAIFFDVENTSRAEHIARVIEQLGVDRTATRTEFIAVGNWRVIGHDTARLLARHGAQLVHSAPSVGVRDWSDLRIAVAAGVWLAAARAGDAIELVSDDRAFDAVGDVAATLGINYRRLSFRRLAAMRAADGGGAAEAIAPEPIRQEEHRGGGDGRSHRRGRRGGRGRDRERGRDHRDRDREREPYVPPPAPVPQAAPTGARVMPETNGEPAIEPHTAPHDEIVSVVQELIERSRDRAVSIDTLANALKSRGFRRPPGSPRLITRLRRIREITIDRTGRITLVDGAQAPSPEAAPVAEEAPPPEPAAAPPEPERRNEREDDEEAPVGNRALPPSQQPEDFDPWNEPTPGNEITGGPGRVPPGEVAPDRRRRRSRRGGRGRHRGRSGQPAAP
jgi:hypothetical protein